MRLSLKSKKILYNWLMSYIVLFLIFASADSLFFFNTRNIITDEINNSNSIMISNLQKQIDTNMINYRQLSYNIKNNSIISKLEDQSDMSKFVFYDALMASIELKKYISGYNSMSLIYIMNKKIGKVISNAGVYDIDEFYSIYYTKDKKEYKSWLSQFDEKAYEKYFIQNNINPQYPTGTQNYVKALSPIEFTDLSLSIVFVINEKDILEQMNKVAASKKSSVLIIDKNRCILSTTNEHYNSNSLYSDLSEYKGVKNLNLNNEMVVITYIQSDETYWKYAIITPYNEYYSKLNNFILVSIIVIILATLIYLGLMILFVKKHYSPLRKLIGLTKKLIIEDHLEYNDEYERIEKAIELAIDERNDLKKQLNSEKKAMKEAFLKNLIMGDIDIKYPIGEALSYYNIKFSTENFVLFMSRIDKTEETMDAIYNTLNNDYILVNLVLTNVIEEIISSNYNIYSTKVDNYLISIVNFRESQIDLVDIKTKANEAREFIKTHYNIGFSYIFSGVHTGIPMIQEAYKEINYALEHKKIFGITGDVSYKDIKDKYDDDEFYYPVSMEQKIINILKDGDANKAKETVNSIFQHNVINGKITTKYAQMLMINMVSTMIRAINEISDNKKESILGEYNLHNMLLKNLSIEQMNKEINNFIDVFCRNITIVNRSNEKYINEEIIPFIKKNFSNENLSLTLIADNFKINLTYLSRIFKESQGEGILEFINTYRMDMAKKFLTEYPHESIEKISEMVGFSNIRTFNRTFRKYVGITPSKYKEQSMES